MIDTHCHIHDDEYELDAENVLAAAREAGVTGVICVGTNASYSQQAVDFAAHHNNVWATVGLHPHEASAVSQISTIATLADQPKVVAVGEIGLDFYYQNSPRDDQVEVLHNQFEIAQQNNLPVVIHLRSKEEDSSDAYQQFWPIYDRYSLPGVVHSFSAHSSQLEEILERGLYVGVNGIATFMKPGEQLNAIQRIPLEKMLLESDAPYLTPTPHRGKINEPKYIEAIAQFLSSLRAEDQSTIEQRTTQNAKAVFRL